MRQTDILVVGAGPAGLGAATEAARAGASVILVDENHKAGGQLFKQIHKFFGSEAHYAGTRGFQIGEILLEEAGRCGVTTLLDTRALGLLDDGTVGLLSGDTVTRVGAKKIILATGAKENALAFPGWTLPGVMTAGAAQTFANVHGTLPGEHILMVGSGNVGLIVSYQLMQAGASIEALVEAAPQITGYRVHAGKIQRAGVPIYTSHTIVEARGEGHVEEAVIAEVDERFRIVAGTEKTIPVDTVLLAVGLNPRTELLAMFRCRTSYEGALGGVLPLHSETMQTTNPDVYVCGDIAGVEEANTALDEGRLAGLCAALSLGYGSEFCGGDTGSLVCGGDTGAARDGAALRRVDELKASLAALRSGTFGVRRRESKQRITERWRGINDE